MESPEEGFVLGGDEDTVLEKGEEGSVLGKAEEGFEDVKNGFVVGKL